MQSASRTSAAAASAEYRRTVGLVMNYGLERIWHEMALACFKALCRYSAGGTEDIPET
jgi:hypothetical protein